MAGALLSGLRHDARIASVAALILIGVLIGVGLTISGHARASAAAAATTAAHTATDSAPARPPSLHGRARALQHLHDHHAIQRFKLGQQGAPDLIRGTLSPPVADGDFAGAVFDFLDVHREAYGLLVPRTELRVTRTSTDRLGMTHLRLRQFHQGVPVMSGELRAHFRPDRVLQTVNGEFFPGIDVPVTPIVDAASAVAQVTGEVRAEPGSVSRELVIYRFAAAYHLAWCVRAAVLSPPGRWEYFIDALTGEVIHRANRLQHAPHAATAGSTATIAEGDSIGTGIGVMGDEKDHIDTYFDGDLYFLEDRTRRFDNDPHGHEGEMESDQSILTHIHFGSLPGEVMEDVDNVWEHASQGAGVDAHVYAAWTYDFLNQNVGRNGHDDEGSAMISTVNISTCQNNAYWDGFQVGYCRAAGGANPMSGGLDVVAHEWGHAVTEFTSNLIYEREWGALNESFSDMMGTRLRWAHDDPGWRIGSYFNGTGFRDMSYPLAFGDPDCRYGPAWIEAESCTPMESNDFCGVHTNSGVPNKMFHLLSVGGTANNRMVTGLGIDTAFKIMYRANQFYWTEQTNFDDAMEGSIAAAFDLDPTGVWATETELAWEAVCVGMPPNVAPVAVTGGPYAGNEGSLILFDGSGSFDPDGTILVYSWDFGDASFGNGALPVHVYALEGSYTVTLLVGDNSGAMGEAVTSVVVSPASAVELAAADVVSVDGMVTILWQTAFEQEHQGFHLWRREWGSRGSDGGPGSTENEGGDADGVGLDEVRLDGVGADGVGMDGAGVGAGGVDVVDGEERLGGAGFERITSDMIRRLAAPDATYEYVDRTVTPGRTYDYRLEAVDLRGEIQLFALPQVTVAGRNPRLSDRIALHPNRPNPFNPRTTIRFELPAPDRVAIRIYDGSGRLVRLLADRRFEAGAGSLEWDGRDDGGRQLHSGVYLCRLQVGGEALTRKVVLVK